MRWGTDFESGGGRRRGASSVARREFGGDRRADSLDAALPPATLAAGGSDRTVGGRGGGSRRSDGCGRGGGAGRGRARSGPREREDLGTVRIVRVVRMAIATTAPLDHLHAKHAQRIGPLRRWFAQRRPLFPHAGAHSNRLPPQTGNTHDRHTERRHHDHSMRCRHNSFGWRRWRN